MAIDDTEKKQDGRQVAVFIITDGEENSSTKYKLNDVSNTITRLTENGWRFSFAGVGVDAFGMGKQMGIQKN